MALKAEREIGGNVLSIETGKIAKQAHGAALVSYGQTTVLGTVVTADPRPGTDFFPLTVDYRERMYAAGKFPGGFFKREGRPGQKEVLTARLIDRPMRPLFPDGYRDEVQIQLIVLTHRPAERPRRVALVAAAAAVQLSPAPFHGPVSGVRVGRVDGKFVINPTLAQLEYSDLDMIVAGHPEAVTMIELGSRELSEKVVADADGVRPQARHQADLRDAPGDRQARRQAQDLGSPRSRHRVSG
jgi:polyribonucleotide nucleotidyltransferase